MYLVSSLDQWVRIGALDKTLRFAAGEEILTEISRKFTPSRLESMLSLAGLNVVRHLEPENGYFSLLLATPG
jgi:L-histidine N-alpha-methyltransferase